MDRIQTPINEKFIDENGILNIIIREGAEFTLENIKADDEANHRLTGGKKVLALVDATNNFTATEEATEYLRSGILNKTRIATAVITNNLASRLLVNFFIHLKKVDSPMRLFNDREKAVEWLMERRDHRSA